jgi:putative transcriptional regulator
MGARSEAAEIISGIREAIAKIRSNDSGRHVYTPSPEEIRRIRSEMKLSQSEFAAFLGVSVHTVHSWETGRRSPSPLFRRILDSVDA